MSDPAVDSVITVQEGERDIDTQMELQYNDRLAFSATGDRPPHLFIVFQIGARQRGRWRLWSSIGADSFGTAS